MYSVQYPSCLSMEPLKASQRYVSLRSAKLALAPLSFRRFKDALAEMGGLDSSTQTTVASSSAKASAQGSSHSVEDSGLPGVVTAAVADEIWGALKVIFRHLTYHNAKADSIAAALSALEPSEATVRTHCVNCRFPTLMHIVAQIQAISSAWAAHGPELVKGSKQSTFGTPWTCTDVGSQLSVCLGSSSASKASDMAGMLRLQLATTGAGSQQKEIITQLGQEELYQLLVKLDTVQQQLDALTA